MSKYTSEVTIPTPQKARSDTVIKKTGDLEIKPEMDGKLFCHGREHAELIWLSGKSQGFKNIKKLSKFKYQIIRTGEVREYNLSDKKDNFDSLRASHKELQSVINCNFSSNEHDKQLFITLTYKENMMDRHRLMKDAEQFFKKLQRKYKGHKLEHITVPEPQGRGAWHLHILLKSDRPLTIPFVELNKIWVFGMTDVKRTKGDNIGTYFGSYFTDTPDPSSAPVGKTGKKYIKGGRLHFYPKGFRLFRCSRNLKRKKTFLMKVAEAYKAFGEPSWKQSWEIDVGYRHPTLLHKAQWNFTKTPNKIYAFTSLAKNL